ncbi:MAG: CRISPR-associated endoribonuclease Cas6 [Candidatus Parvarchaeota archaeon]
MSSLIPLKFQGKPSWLNARLFSLYINTVHPDIEEIFLSALTPGTVLILNSCMLNVLSIESKIITMDHLPLIPQLKCRGPVVIREKGKYFRVGDENFESHLISALKRKADAVVGKDTVVRGVKIINSRRKLYKVAGHNVPASILSFIVDADEDVIRTALTYGVGAKTQMGFGMVVLSE